MLSSQAEPRSAESGANDLMLRFFRAARGAGCRISPPESMDAMNAVAAVGYRDRESLRDALLLELTPRPGVVEFLARVEASGRPFGIASSSRHVWVDGHLQNLGWRHRFGVLATRDRAGAPKPDPATYLLAAQELGVDPRKCMAVEDSRNGMLAGLAAGMSVLVCPNAVTQSMDFSGAMAVVDRLDAF